MRHPVDHLVAAERAVELGHQVEPHSVPVVAQPGHHCTVERHAASLLLGGYPLKLGAEQRVRQRRPQCRHDVRQQTRQRAHVVLAVVQDVALFLRR